MWLSWLQSFQKPTISLRRKVKTGGLRSCRRAADWLIPSIHLSFPALHLSLPAAPAPASTRLSHLQLGQSGCPPGAAQTMEAFAGDDEDPGDLRAHCPASPAATRSASAGVRGAGQAQELP